MYKNIRLNKYFEWKDIILKKNYDLFYVKFCRRKCSFSHDIFEHILHLHITHDWLISVSY